MPAGSIAYAVRTALGSSLSAVQYRPQGDAVNLSSQHKGLTLITMASEACHDDLASAAREGLTAKRKWLPCRFFYDAEGSRLFEAICDLPEYYLTSAETEILRNASEEIARLYRDRPALVELGSGSSTKTRILIEAFLTRHGGLRYVPVDISRSILEESALALLDDYPGLEILAIAAEYRQGLRRMRCEKTAAKLVLWLGSSVGNFTREGAVRFLAALREELSVQDHVLLGVDLRKQAQVIEAAYDDNAGVTARFNKNLLTRINRELTADFNLEEFEHSAVYKVETGRVEMHLRSRRAQVIHIEGLELDVHLEQGETIHTENSYKYSASEIADLADKAGMCIERQWFDSGKNFSVNLLSPV